MSTPFVGVFNTAFATAIIELDKPSIDVFVAILERADRFGRAFPGEQYLARRSRHRRERVSECLRKLHALDLLRSLWECGDGPPLLAWYMVSPLIFAAHPQMRAAAARMWMALPQGLPEGALFSSRAEGPSITYAGNDLPPHAQLSEEGWINSRSSDLHQPDQPDLHSYGSTDQPPTGAWTKAPAHGAPNGAGKTGEGRKEEKPRTAPNGANPPAAKPQNAPNPPVPRPPLSPRPEPLEAALEGVAEDLYRHSHYEMSLAIARALVAAHGPQAARAAIGHLASQRPHSIESRAGYLRWYIERQAVDPDRDGRAAPGAIAGSLNDVIQE